MLCSVQGFAVCMAERQRETNQWQGISGVHVVCIDSKGVSSTWALARVARGRREIENRLRSVREDECRGAEKARASQSSRRLENLPWCCCAIAGNHF